jgi:hypothetical protein
MTAGCSLTSAMRTVQTSDLGYSERNVLAALLRKVCPLHL